MSSMKVTKTTRVEFGSLVSGLSRTVGIDHDGQLIVVGSKLPAEDLDRLIEALQVLKGALSVSGDPPKPDKDKTARIGDAVRIKKGEAGYNGVAGEEGTVVGIQYTVELKSHTKTIRESDVFFDTFEVIK